MHAQLAWHRCHETIAPFLFLSPPSAMAKLSQSPFRYMSADGAKSSCLARPMWAQEVIVMQKRLSASGLVPIAVLLACKCYGSEACHTYVRFCKDRIIPLKHVCEGCPFYEEVDEHG